MRSQRGFTLIELLVVVAILGILASVVTMSLIGLTASADSKACSQEASVVQAAMDGYMSSNTLSAVPTPTSATNSMSSPLPLYPNFIREQTTRGVYTWQSNGQVTPGTC